MDLVDQVLQRLVTDLWASISPEQHLADALRPRIAGLRDKVEMGIGLGKSLGDLAPQAVTALSWCQVATSATSTLTRSAR